MAAKASEYGLDMGNPDHVAYAAEEVLAEMAQATPRLHFVQRAIAAIRTWLRKHVPGLQSIKLTDAEIINNYILPARAWVERGGPDGNGPRGGQRIEPVMSRAEASGATDSDNILFSRAKMAELKDKGLQMAHTYMSHPGKVSLWDKTVGTMRHISERYPAFKPVFEAAQQFIDDVSSIANEAAQYAPRLIPRVETLSDLRKKPISVVDNRAIGKALFGGTLDWGRDQHGKAMPLEELKAKYAGLTAKNLTACVGVSLMALAGCASSPHQGVGSIPLQAPEAWAMTPSTSVQTYNAVFSTYENPSAKTPPK